MGKESSEELIEEAINAADMGRKYWIRLLEENNITKRDMVIFMVNSEQEYNYYTLQYLKDLKRNSKIRNIFVVSDLHGAAKYVEKYATEKVTFIGCMHEEVEAICRLYMLYKFTRQIIINTYDGTSDVDAGRLVGVGDISVKDIVAVSILGLPKVPDEVK
ncbi:MAG: hypothetical protein E7259_07340 [Lachnospiraceae bacterium]|nr:hypothetical protein [Lachnospiraceae bacterium]